MPDPVILQIMPADGWRWRLSSWPAGESHTLAAWALVRREWGGEGAEVNVEGVDPRCDGIYGLVEEWGREAQGFLEYIAPEPAPRPEGAVAR